MKDRSSFYRRNFYLFLFLSILTCNTLMAGQLNGNDTDLTRRTMQGLKGIGVIVEEFQANFQKYGQKAGLTREQVQSNIEGKLKSAGITVLTWDEWLKTVGRPALYVRINTHEHERYSYAYDIRIELRQIVSLEANPSIKTLANTWSLGMTGTAHIGNLNVIKGNLDALIDRFISSFKKANENGKKR
ncbi:MAG: hypothetical protein N2745_03445 [Syntrophorhabdaceae bacterium]|nr:hypothetical protein [Syntrophorhabdaceae bacterium]